MIDTTPGITAGVRQNGASWRICACRAAPPPAQHPQFRQYFLRFTPPSEPIIPHERKPQARESAGGSDSGEGTHMKRMIAAAVAVVGLAAMASAQTPYGPIQGVAAPGCAGCAAPAAQGPVFGGFGGAAAASRPAMFAGFGLGGRGCRECDPKFGLAPFFKKLMFWKKDNSCGSCGRLLGGCGGGNCAGQPGGGAAFNGSGVKRRVKNSATGNRPMMNQPWARTASI